MISRLLQAISTGVRRLVASDAGAGIVLLIAAVAALAVANSPLWPLYEDLGSFECGFGALGLHLQLREWITDGLLAVFFFTVGLDLKEEFVSGILRDPKIAVLPVAAACGGVVCPAVIYVLAVMPIGGGAIDGWAVPTATDIAFAVSILAVVGKGLPHQLRAFLLTLAVVDDLIGIAIIAFYYTAGIHALPLLLALGALALFAFLLRKGITSPLIVVPLAGIAWVLVHASGIHPTICGVALGLCVPASAPWKGQNSMARMLARKLAPYSKLLIVPIFAFFAAGVNVGGWSGLALRLQEPVTLAIVAALTLGKMLGITGTTFVLTRLPVLSLPKGLRWSEMIGMGFVAGIGFTVSMLIGELAFGARSALDDESKIGVLVGSLLSASIGALILQICVRYRRSRLVQGNDSGAVRQ
ncbi:MAG: Na+/H+ antiporter NhaA [Bifidobacterium aquikefiri]|uniref:Na(+)/H(+) antiporter NhaA n=1 Tax=Bifidobacterium aquikefiri TaxID=1653207 RepID=A0A261G3N4_9BIFI|nr:Na+/H+ antiporter NhaA [Bifidobacterium aquikefiri]OZG66034.1 sodium:proton antiporter [Bifidobacterium aquikefiri]